MVSTSFHIDAQPPLARQLTDVSAAVTARCQLFYSCHSSVATGPLGRHGKLSRLLPTAAELSRRHKPQGAGQNEAREIADFLPEQNLERLF